MADASTTQLVVVALAGGLASQVIGAATTTLGYRREDHARWLEHRRDVYLSWLDACRLLEEVIRQVNAEAPEATEETEDHRRRAHAVCAQMLRQLQMLAPYHVVGLAVTHDQALKGLERLVDANDGIPLHSDDVAGHRRHIGQTEQAFIRAARRDMRIPTGLGSFLAHPTAVRDLARYLDHDEGADTPPRRSRWRARS